MPTVGGNTVLISCRLIDKFNNDKPRLVGHKKWKNLLLVVKIYGLGYSETSL